MAKVYYNRTMSDKVMKALQSKFQWVVDYVKKNPQLDFQTGSNNSSSWFSVYRGTSRVFTIKPSGKVDAAAAYLDRYPEFYKSPSPELFDNLLEVVNHDMKFDRYYADEKKKEGYFQTLIGRRYTLFGEGNDDFIIIDKELVVGFENKDEKERWNLPIKDDIKQKVDQARKDLSPTRIPSDIHTTHGEFDFLALNWDGDIIIMELKQGDPTNTYLSPFQIRYYKLQFEKLLGDLPNLYEDMKSMILQKQALGILNIPAGRRLPSKLSGRIKCYLIVGEEDFSEEICRRYRIIKDIALPELEAYTCDEHGTLIPSKKL